MKHSIAIHRQFRLLAACCFLFAAVAGGLAYPNYNTNPIPPDSSGMESSAQEIAARIQVGWNMGNSLEAYGCQPPSETCWGNPPANSSLLFLVKQSGFDALRLPCSYDQYADQGTAQIDINWLNRVKEVVQLCVDQDFYVILNIHWDGGWLENNVMPAAQADVNAKQKAFWEQIATHLRDFDEHLMFASANEPNVSDATQMAVLMSYHQTFVDAVRSTGGRNAYRVLVVQGPNTDIETTDNLMNSLPVDTVANRMMVEVHYYTPWQFCGLTEDAGWGDMFYYWGEDHHSTNEPSRNATWGEEDWLDYLFGLMKTKFVDQGIPVVLGEYSATRRNYPADLALHLDSRAHFHDYVTERSNANGFLPFYWDNGYTGNHGSGIFNRWSNTVFDQQSVDALTQVETPQYWQGASPASNPTPADGATGVALAAGLSWTAGTNADSHRVFFGYDSNLVATATTNSPQFMGIQAGTVYAPGTLAASGRFYWRIDEMAGDLATTGPVWTFATVTAPSGVTTAGAMISADVFELSFPSSWGQTYRIESTDRLNPASWMIISNNIPGTGDPIEIPNSALSTQRFYRVVILTP